MSLPLVAYQGTAGAFSEAAISHALPEGAVPVPCPTFDETVEALACGRVDFALLPVDNSTVGPVEASRAALLRRNAEVEVRDVVTIQVQHALLALPGATLNNMREVRSHPMALAQCRRFLSALPHVAVVASFDTAGAAHEVATSGDDSIAAIASEYAGVQYGLISLARNIQDDARNETRFVLVARRAHNVDTLASTA